MVEYGRWLAAVLNDFLLPIRERRIQLSENLNYVKDILMTGTEKVRNVAKQTIEEVREAMSIKYF